MAEWEELQTDGQRIHWLRENLSTAIGLLQRRTEQMDDLQQRVQTLERELEKIIGLPLR
jgi:hypothetical protein